MEVMAKYDGGSGVLPPRWYSVMDLGTARAITGERGSWKDGTSYLGSNRAESVGGPAGIARASGDGGQAVDSWRSRSAWLLRDTRGEDGDDSRGPRVSDRAKESGARESG